MLRCLIVDDSPRFLDAARGLLERQGITVVGVASNSTEALRCAVELDPDVTLLDIDLGGKAASTLVRRASLRGWCGTDSGHPDLHPRRAGLCRADRRQPGGRIPFQDSDLCHAIQDLLDNNPTASASDPVTGPQET